MRSRTLEFVLALSMFFIGISFGGVVGARLGLIPNNLNTIILGITSLITIIAAIVVFYDVAKGE